eukprot:gb/GEZN01026429.1/.p1 GENE.gb/GEZN01026429.1/~~gb/GEZN01026429.1/.p1  ORF type:complete len:145 (-),score=4.97 gb/GEZN01026429.1/:88-465(-)
MNRITRTVVKETLRQPQTLITRHRGSWVGTRAKVIPGTGGLIDDPNVSVEPHHDEHGPVDYEDVDYDAVVYRGPYRGHEMPGAHKASHGPYSPEFVIGIMIGTWAIGFGGGMGAIYYQQVKNGYW